MDPIKKECTKILLTINIVQLYDGLTKTKHFVDYP